MLMRWINLFLSPFGYKPMLKLRKVKETYIDYVKQVNLNGADFFVYFNDQKEVESVEHFMIDDEKCPFCTEEEQEKCSILTSRKNEVQLLLV